MKYMHRSTTILTNEENNPCHPIPSIALSASLSECRTCFIITFLIAHPKLPATTRRIPSVGSKARLSFIVVLLVPTIKRPAADSEGTLARKEKTAKNEG
jgi:hypothetical protein